MSAKKVIVGIVVVIALAVLAYLAISSATPGGPIIVIRPLGTLDATVTPAVVTGYTAEWYIGCTPKPDPNMPPPPPPDAAVPSDIDDIPWRYANLVKSGSIMVATTNDEIDASKIELMIDFKSLVIELSAINEVPGWEFGANRLNGIPFEDKQHWPKEMFGEIQSLTVTKRSDGSIQQVALGTLKDIRLSYNRSIYPDCWK